MSKNMDQNKMDYRKLRGTEEYKAIVDFVKEQDMLSVTGRLGVICGISGGADSVFLLHALLSMSTDRRACSNEYVIRAVHVNHMIRGEEADRDEAFVKKLCEFLGVPLTICREDIPALAKKEGMTVEEAGRAYRYSCFEKEAETLICEGLAEEVRIAVAHNRNDLAETVIYNMVRGSSVSGLAGIPPKRDRIIRPLLMTSRDEIEECISLLGADYVIDSTNLSHDYTRNKIRLDIMPLLREINDGADRHIAQLALDALDIRKSVQGERVLAMIEEACGKRKDITREHISAVLKLYDKENGKKVDLPYGLEAVKENNTVVIRKIEDSSKRINEWFEGLIRAAEAENSEVISPDEYREITKADYSVIGRILERTMDFSEGLSISKKEYTKMVDCDKLETVPVFRTPQEGDYMVVTSEGKKKKLSRIFTDAKVPQEIRKTFPVVACGNEVIWAVGLRLGESAKITDETKKIKILKYMR